MSNSQENDIIEIYLEGKYTPPDHFDGPQTFDDPDAVVTFNNGKARVSLKEAISDLRDGEVKRWIAKIAYILELRQVLTGTTCTFNGLAEYRVESDGRCAHNVSAESRVSVKVRVKALGSNATPGAVRIPDPLAEEQKKHKEFIQRGLRHLSDSVVRKLISSFGQALNDPNDFLTHLYEIRDAVAQFFGGEKGVREKLEVTRAEWSRFGQLANDAPVSESRHRGTHIELRPASEEEKLAAMGFARRLIEAYLDFLDQKTA